MCKDWIGYKGLCGHSVDKNIREECHVYKETGRCRRQVQYASWCSEEKLRELNIEPTRCGLCYARKMTKSFEDTKATDPNHASIEQLTLMHLYITMWPDLPAPEMDSIHEAVMLKWRWSRVIPDVVILMTENGVCTYFQALNTFAEIKQQLDKLQGDSNGGQTSGSGQT